MRKFTKYPQGYVKASSNIASKEYAVEIWTITGNKYNPSRLYQQVDVFPTFKEAQEYCDTTNLDDPDDYFRVVEIAYDADGNEVYANGVYESATDEQINRLYPD